MAAESPLDDYRKQSLEGWERQAQVWTAEREFIWGVSQHVGNWLVDKVDPKPGDTLLELGVGTGETGFQATGRVGDTGRVISTDFSAPMVESARSGAQQLGISNLEFRVMDAEHMDLDDDSVDGVICRWGYMLMADPDRAMSETRRVLRPGGRLAFSVWGPPDRNPWSSQPGIVLVQRGAMPAPEPGMPGIFALADKDRLRSLVTGAGFDEPTIEEFPIMWEFGDFDEGFDFFARVGGPLSRALATLTDEEGAEVRGEVHERLKEFVTDDGFRISGLCLNVVAQ